MGVPLFLSILFFHETREKKENQQESARLNHEPVIGHSYITYSILTTTVAAPVKEQSISSLQL